MWATPWYDALSLCGVHLGMMHCHCVCGVHLGMQCKTVLYTIHSECQLCNQYTGEVSILLSVKTLVVTDANSD